MKDKERFVKNNLFVFISKFLTKIITFGIMVFFTRSLSSEDFGNLAILLTLSSIFIVLHDFGTSTVVVRETSTNYSKAKDILVTTLTLKLVFSIVFYFAFIGVTLLLDYNEKIVFASFIFALGMIFQSFLITLIKHYEGLEKMKYSSILIIGERIIFGIVLILLSAYFNSILLYGYSYLFSGIVVIFIGFLITIKIGKVFSHFNFQLLKTIIKSTRVFFILALFSAFYTRVDIILISKLLNEVQVGIYKANYQIIETFYFIALSLGVSILPFFVRILAKRKYDIGGIYNKIMGQFFIISLYFTTIIFFNAQYILSLLYNKYDESSMLLSLLSLTLPFYFSNIINGNLLIALKKEKLVTFSMVFTTILKISLIYFLLLKIGLKGAIISVIIVEFIAYLIQFFGIRKEGFNLHFISNEKTSLMVIVLFAILLYLIKIKIIIFVSSLLVGVFVSRNMFVLLRENILRNK